MKRRIACLAVCLLAVLLPLRALAAEETAAVQTRTGDWALSRSAMPGEELHFRATLTLRTGESWTVRSVFSPGVEFLALTAVRADGESVNASYYTLVTGARSKESAFALHLAARFSARESVCLTVEWTARLDDGCVTGAEDHATAKTGAKSIVCSSLVKAAMFGADANWGRVLCAIGYSGTHVDVHKVDVFFRSAAGTVCVCTGGAGVPFSEEEAKQILLEKEIEILVDLNAGDEGATAWGCDLTYDYVKINGDYRT